MPNYAFLFDKKTDVKALPSKLAVQARLGVPYKPMTDQEILEDARRQAIGIKGDLVKAGASPQLSEECQLVALISYLQKLGQSEEVENPPKLTPLSARKFPIVPDVPDRQRTALVSPAPAAPNP